MFLSRFKPSKRLLINKIPLKPLTFHQRFHNINLEKIRNIGIAAHIDSGKTTVSERILYYAGKIDEIHEVRGKDKVGATMDSMDLERERGITIQSAATSFDWQGHSFNLIDTPGHVDFTIEVERSLRVLDGAVLVVCASSGIQSQTLTVHRQMKRYDIPTVAFINKLDRMGADPIKCLTGIRERLHRTSALLHLPIGLQQHCKGIVDLIRMKALYYEGENGEKVVYEEIPSDLKEKAIEYRQNLIETLADIDEQIGEKYLMEETITNNDIEAAIRRQTIALKFTPILMGSALKNKGVQEIIDAATKFLPNPTEVDNFAVKSIDQQKAKEASDEDEEYEIPKMKMNPYIDQETLDNNMGIGLAFKLDSTPTGQLTYIRMYQGKFRKGDTLVNTRTNEKIKVQKLCKMHANKMKYVDELYAGDIAAFFGIDCASGDTFMHSKVKRENILSMESIFVPDPVVSLSVKPAKDDIKNNQIMQKAITRFAKEDPTFVPKYDEDTKELTISGMGELHLEIYAQRMAREYNCPIILGQPKVLYYETFLSDCSWEYQHKKQTGGRGQYAKAEGIMTPTFDARNTVHEINVINKSDPNVLPRNFFPPLEKGLLEGAQKGPLIDKPLIGFDITVLDGKIHQVDSSDYAFMECGRLAMAQIMEVGTKVIGPFMKVEIAVPVEFTNNTVEVVTNRHGYIIEQDEDLEFATITAEVMLNDMFGFTAELRQNTQGKGEYTMEFARYDYIREETESMLVEEYKKSLQPEVKGKKRSAKKQGRG